MRARGVASERACAHTRRGEGGGGAVCSHPFLPPRRTALKLKRSYGAALCRVARPGRAHAASAWPRSAACLLRPHTFALRSPQPRCHRSWSPLLAAGPNGIQARLPRRWTTTGTRSCIGRHGAASWRRRACCSSGAWRSTRWTATATPRCTGRLARSSGRCRTCTELKCVRVVAVAAVGPPWTATPTWPRRFWLRAPTPTWLPPTEVRAAALAKPGVRD